MHKTAFVPQLFIPPGTKNLEFYKEAFSAVVLRSWNNDDGSIHVAEMELEGAIFHVHEENPARGSLSPARAGGVTTIIGLMVNDVHTVMASATAAGATVADPAKDYDYGYRQGSIIDPLGHHWLIEQKI